MSENSRSISLVRWTARIVAALGLGFVFVPLIWSWVEKLPDETVELYVTSVGVPLLTFAGFLAVYLGFLSQREQNELQKEQLEAQQKNFEKDRFESTFFQLLRTHNHIVEDIRCEEERFRNRKPSEIVETSGRGCFKMFYSEFEELFEKKIEEKDWGDSESVEEGKVGWVYANWFSDRKSELNHYFSHLSKLISFVDRSDVEDKEFYIDLVVAQMSAPELKLFFYHTATKRDDGGYEYVGDVYEQLGEYSFFEQVDKSTLIHDRHYELNREALGMK